MVTLTSGLISDLWLIDCLISESVGRYSEARILSAMSIKGCTSHAESAFPTTGKR